MVLEVLAFDLEVLDELALALPLVLVPALEVVALDDDDDDALLVVEVGDLFFFRRGRFIIGRG